MDRPRKSIARNVPVKETARPTATHSASRISRNSARAMKTRSSPSSPFFTMRPSRPPTSSASSLQTATSTPAGRLGRTSAAR